MRDRAGMAAAAGWAMALGLAGWLRHTNHWSGAFDLGVFDQAAWQLSHGRTTVSLVERSIFADHFSPVVLVFAPLYLLAATPAWLIAVQAVALGATVLPMRALARDLGVPPWLATLLVCGNAPLLAAAIFDFHPSTLAVPFIACTVLFVHRRQPGPATASALGVALCRADLSFVLLGLAVVATGRMRRRLVVVAVVGSLVGAVVPDVLGNPGAWDSYFSHLGEGPVDLALHPWRLVSAIVDADALGVAAGWALSAGLLVLLQPRWCAAAILAAIPVLASSWAGTKLPWFHYGAPYTPLLVAGSLAAFAQADGLLARLRRPVRYGVAGLGVAAGLALLSPLSPAAPAGLRVTTTLSERSGVDVDAALRSIGPDDVVSAELGVLAQVMHRTGAHLYPLPFERATSTYPPGLAPPPTARRAAEVDVVVIRDDQEPGLPASVRRDFEVVSRPEGLVVLRRG